MGDNGRGAPAEEIEKVVDEALVRTLPVDRWLEDPGVSDLARLANDSLFLETIQDRLHGCVCGTPLLGNGFLDLADRALAEAPEDVHELELEAGEAGRFHSVSYVCGARYYSCSRNVKRCLRSV